MLTARSSTPWHREATYQVPKALPACPPGGCTCAWLWVPRGCGQPNIYMQGFKCQVSGATSTTPVAKAQAPAQCEDDSSKCVAGAKQMIVWNQLTGNNVVTKDRQTPAYNIRNGFKPGAQDDIFAGAPAAPGSSITSSATSTSSSAIVDITSSSSAVTRIPVVTTSRLAMSSIVSQPIPTTFSTTIRPDSPPGGDQDPATITVTVTASAGCS